MMDGRVVGQLEKKKEKEKTNPMVYKEENNTISSQMPKY